MPGHSRAEVDGGPGGAIPERHGQGQAVVPQLGVPIVEPGRVFDEGLLGTGGHRHLLLSHIVQEAAVVENALPMVGFPLTQNHALTFSSVRFDKLGLGEHHHGGELQALLGDVGLADGRWQLAGTGYRVHYAFRVNREPDGFVPGLLFRYVLVKLHDYLVPYGVGNIIPHYFPLAIGEHVRSDDGGGSLVQLK